jgi:DNA processing protein
VYLSMKPDNEKYPQLLASRLSNAPVLQVIGDAELLSFKAINVIGSRTHTDYGLSVVKEVCQAFSGSSIVLVSGLAGGTDFNVHTLSIAHNCKTLGVLGFGLGYLKDFENYELVLSIIKAGGCVISPFSYDQKPTRTTFIERNKIMAALSNSVIVIEATARTGTFYAVQAAVDYDVPIFAVPGSIFSKTSRGAHELIKSGAYLLDNPTEVRRLLDFDK